MTNNNQSLEDSCDELEDFAMLGRLYVGLSHDLKNMLGIIDMSHQLIDSTLDESNFKNKEEYKSVKECLANSKKVIGYINHLNDEICMVSRGEKGLVNVYNSIDITIDLLNHKTNKKVKIEKKLNKSYNPIIRGYSSHIVSAFAKIGRAHV